MTHSIVFAAALKASALAAPAVTDCPMRDAPFSARSPLIDILLNPRAKELLQKYSAGDLSRVPASIFGTKPPTYAAILTPSDVRFTGIPVDRLPQLDAELRRVPVTADDKRLRCQRYDNEVPTLTPAGRSKLRLLVFEKINGFRDEPSVNAAHAALATMSERKGWSVTFTEKGGAFNARTLAQVDAVVWNNISGDVLTLSQRQALKAFLRAGGGFSAVHGSAGDPVYYWDWYADKLIGARFAGHPMAPQFQEARIIVSTDHPVAQAARLPREWRMTDEWYSFRTSPRAAGAKVIASLDEQSYTRKGATPEVRLDMGADHPVAWTNCLGRGRVFYSAIGHLPQTYSQPQANALLEAGIEWTAKAKSACPSVASNRRNQAK